MKDYNYHDITISVLFGEGDVSGQGCIDEIINREDYDLYKFRNLTGVIVDVGANIGIATLILAKLNPAATIYAIEPSRTTYNILMHNINLNGLTNVIALNIGIGQTNGKVELLINPSMSGQNTIYSDQDSFSRQVGYMDKQDVDILTWKVFMEQNNIEVIDLLKIDAEGCEFDIQYTANIKNVVGEIHELKRTGNGEELLQTIKNNVNGIVKLTILKTNH
jgi:FkbM family methyltransferase